MVRRRLQLRACSRRKRLKFRVASEDIQFTLSTPSYHTSSLSISHSVPFVVVEDLLRPTIISRVIANRGAVLAEPLILATASSQSMFESLVVCYEHNTSGDFHSSTPAEKPSSFVRHFVRTFIRVIGSSSLASDHQWPGWPDW